MPARPAAGRPPWFRRHPRLAVALSAALYLGVLALRWSEPSAEVPVGLLYSLPVALLAVAFGRRAGLLSGLLAVLSVVSWSVLADADYSPLSWVTRTAPILLLGVLLGDAADRLVRSEAEAQHSRAAAERAREAVELNDTVVQGLAAAKWALEAGRSERGLQIVSETLAESQRLVSQLLREAGMGVGRLDAGRPDVAVPQEPETEKVISSG